MMSYLNEAHIFNFNGKVCLLDPPVFVYVVYVHCTYTASICALWTSCLWSEMCESLALTDEMVKHKGRRCCMTALCTHLWSLGFVLEQTCGFWLVEVVEYLMIVLTWICVWNEDLSVSLCSSAELVFLLWTCWRWDSFMLVNCFQDSHITMSIYSQVERGVDVF